MAVSLLTMEEESKICDECTDRPISCRSPCVKLYQIELRRAKDRIVDLEQKVSILLHPQLRNSRFDFNARYIRFDEAQQIAEFSSITHFLENAKNFVPYEVGDFTFYRRGTGGLWLYVVPTCDFRVPRERKAHKVEPVKSAGSDKTGGKTQ